MNGIGAITKVVGESMFAPSAMEASSENTGDYDPDPHETPDMVVPSV